MMGGVKVETPSGTWVVRRRWAPRHLGSHTVWARFRHRNRVVRRRTAELGDVGDPGCAVDVAEGFLVFVGVVVAVVFLIFVGIPVLVALGELLVIVVLALAGLIGRVLFRRPWTVDAVSPDGAHHRWSVVGWNASGQARSYVARRIETTGSVPTEAEVASAVRT
jgi:hypothetical protein